MSELDKKIQQAILDSKEYLSLLCKISESINLECKSANSEETIAVRIEEGIRDSLKWHGIDFKPIREETIKTKVLGKVSNKRLDSRFNNIIFEYKKDINHYSLEDNSTQLEQYIITLSKNEKQLIDKYIGILTDGNNIRFINFANNEVYYSSLLKFDRASFKEIIKVILSLQKKDLSSNNLLKDFSITATHSITKKLAKELYRKLENPSDKTFMLHSEWERLFKLASQNENNMKLIKERNAALSDCFDLPLNKFNHAIGLFAIQTTYTIIIKLLAYYIVADIFFKKSDLKISDLLKLNSDSLRARLEFIENGEIFKQLGIKNLLEGDFFSWYVYQEAWSPEIFEAIKECISLLNVYDSNQYLFNINNIHDLFIDLYQSMIPTEVRRSLGEYYTPTWLAEHVIKNADKPKNWKGLDPCAGSGTFVLQMIQEILNETECNKNNLYKEIISRVKALDINPLAVLTCRINYFIAISHLIEVDSMNDFELPVYLGDSAFVPQLTKIGNTEVIEYSIATKKGKIEFTLPVSIILENNNLSKEIVKIENAIISLDKEKAKTIVLNLLPEKDRTYEILRKIDEFIDHLILLERQNWDRIWVRIIIGFLKVATLGKFEVIVGNPPWIDWKTLPDGYRETLKSICIDRHLFSGDNFTGGINLNVCALITNVVASNWLAKDGILAFLMPKSLAFQQSYAGFRELIQNDGTNLKYIKFFDWTEAGHPFRPVTEKFMSYYLQKTNKPQLEIIPTTKLKLKKNSSIESSIHESLESVLTKFDQIKLYAFKNTTGFNNFTFEEDYNLVSKMKKIAGETLYKGRVGLGIYPKELLLFEIKGKVNNNLVKVENYQGRQTERKFAKIQTILETKFLHPVIEGPNIRKFGIENIRFVAPLPYTFEDTKNPIDSNTLEAESPLLYQYYMNNKSNMKKTKYNEKVQGGKGAFYSLTRVGKYTFAKHRVIYRNNTKWVATVISSTLTEWGGSKDYILLDHACSISQDNDGRFITEDEAHYISAILNSNLVSRYIINSSDSRSFKTILPLNIVKYDNEDWTHKTLSELSKIAHKSKINEKTLDKVLDYLMLKYINELIDKKENNKTSFDIQLDLSNPEWIFIFEDILNKIKTL